MGKFEIGIAFLFMALLFLVLFFRQYRRKALSDNTATSRIKSIKEKLPEGIVEIKGRAVCDRPLTSRLSGIECVYFSYHLQDYSAEGSVYKDRSGPGFKSGTTLSSSTSGCGEMWADFQVQDSTGSIKVFGRGAEVHGKATYDGFYRGPKGELSEVLNKTSKLERNMDIKFRSDLGELVGTLMGPQKTGSALLATRVSEEIIPVGSQVYILAKITEVRGERIIMRDDSGSLFLISTLSEEELVNKTSKWMWGYLMICIFNLMIGFALLFPYIKK